MIDKELRLQVEQECQKIGCCIHCSRRFTGDRVLDNYVAKSTDSAADEEPSAKKPKLDLCVFCFGVLSSSCVEYLSSKAVSSLEAASYDEPVFTTTLSMPVCTLVRDKSLYLHLKRSVPGYGEKVRFTHLLPLKDIWKQLINGRIASGAGKAADNGYFAELMVNVEMAYRGDRREVEVISKLRPGGRDLVTRTMADSALEASPEAKLLHCLTVPPGPPVAPPTYQLTCCRNAIFVAGRYNKYSRNMSQTPWHVDGARRTESSLQEVITDPLVSLTKASGVRFSASGREDVDVRTLGRGRPFVAELADPHVAQLSAEQLRQLQRTVNAVHPEVRVRDLQLVTREQTANLKEGEEDKTKSYTALVQSLSGPLAPERLAPLAAARDLVISQQTPVRVLHRRPMATRQKTVLWMRPEPVTDTLFKLHLQTQAGTYIKEFVHGDFGRTEPNVGTLLGGKFDILALDVESIELDWPPALDDEDGDTAEPCATVEPGAQA
ncbi:tRNA pseudouridine synthase Pus10-like [Pollicipes pollicipes]|uniref:tRNA pseudouridine synthase Pus10-like n=1 Tax=Pollicipes pollicipes TaxID=41117 RepID=UPI001884DB9B|nr:tRNA pseudouridine synthase Pus10-like [Pollicipes pollicipes]XP_037072191.1 tRNA pseudouridine synthase Pus10-like [Pollicipes pollicipes]XP_037072192.1 tRNA pseudouridine synthase Pus10-like [Pollicipes pollicipes]